MTKLTCAFCKCANTAKNWFNVLWFTTPNTAFSGDCYIFTYMLQPRRLTNWPAKGASPKNSSTLLSVETLLSDREMLLERLPLEASSEGNRSKSSSVSVSMSLERLLYSCWQEEGDVRQRIDANTSEHSTRGENIVAKFTRRSVKAATKLNDDRWSDSKNNYYL